MSRAWWSGCLPLLGACLLSACTRDWDVAAQERGLDSGAEADVALEAGSSDEPSAPDRRVGAGEPDAEGPEPDASTAEPDGSAPADAAFDVLSDASAPGDAETPPLDGGASDASATSGFCATQPATVFCADFEDGALDTFSWQELTPSAPAKLEIVEGGATPGSRALRSSLSGAGEETARVALRLANGEPSWFHAAFDFLPQFELLAQGGQVFWFKLTEQTGENFPGVGLASDAEGGTLLIQKFDGVTDSYETYALQRLPAGWVHVDVTITFGVSGSVNVRFNGALAAVYKGPLHVPAVDQTYLQLGVYAQQALAPVALYDNLVVECGL